MEKGKDREVKDGCIEKLVKLNRVTKVVKGGKRFFCIFKEGAPVLGKDNSPALFLEEASSQFLFKGSH